MISGNNYVYYETVAAYSVSPQNARVFSGGGGDHTVVTEGTTFYWVYDPENPSDAGFTGAGWLDNVAGSPLAVAGISGQTVQDQLVNGERQNLNDIFKTWQDYVNVQKEQENYSVVSNFIVNLVSKGGTSSCFTVS